MYFLDGDRIYIKPERACSTLEEQVESCCMKLLKINSGKRIFKLNFFVDTESDEAYAALRAQVKKRVAGLFSENILLSFIAQPPLTCKIIVEAFYYDPAVWHMQSVSEGENGTAIFRNQNARIVVGNVRSNQNISCRGNSEKAFETLSDVLEKAGFSLENIVRQWNYLENILGFDEKEQRYQAFNDVRSHYYGSVFENNGYPAATGIGMNRGGVIIEFVAVKGEEVITSPVDNPEQISAHSYSEKVLVGEECLAKTTPKFERARYFCYGGKKQIFISGTASITGENTVGVGDPVLQTEVTIQNIQRLYSGEVLRKLADEKLEPKYGHARVYVKNRKDFHAIRRTFKKHFGNLPVVYIIADICRDNLLVEIEGKVILE